MNKIKILGYGEIGKSLHEVYKKAGIKDVAWRDLVESEGPVECDILNISIPFSDQFTSEVYKEILASNPKMVIIHSTVAPGTTRNIAEWLKTVELDDVIIAHSPVIGVHPNLSQGILTFRKWVGVESEQDVGYKEIFKHFSLMGIHDRGVVAPYEATELYKILDTTYYGVTIGFNMAVKKFLEENGVRYDTWVKYNEKYNEGYKKLGMPNVIRPVYKELTEGFGGHCVYENADMLYNNAPMNTDLASALNVILTQGKIKK